MTPKARRARARYCLVACAPRVSVPLRASPFTSHTQVADHGIGYAPFWAGGIPLSAAPSRLVEVVVDNRFNATRAFLHGAGTSSSYDFYQYGGLIRSVTWHELAAPAPLEAADVLIADAVSGRVSLRVRLADAARTTWLFPPHVCASAPRTRRHAAAVARDRERHS